MPVCGTWRRGLAHSRWELSNLPMWFSDDRTSLSEAMGGLLAFQVSGCFQVTDRSQEQGTFGQL